MLSTARELFVSTGYGATTIPDIAARAGVSLDTIYAQAITAVQRHDGYCHPSWSS